MIGTLSLTASKPSGIAAKNEMELTKITFIKLLIFVSILLFTQILKIY